MSFDKLMAELAEAGQAQEALSKALPTDEGNDDQAIAAAAAEGGAQGDEDKDDKGKDKDGKGAPMAKSLKVTLENGDVVDALDGEEMIKSLTERLDVTESTMTKALTGALNLIKGQNDLIKSLSDRITKLGSEGRGRKAVVTLTEKKDQTQTLAKSESQGMSAGEFMTKAMDAMKAGRLTSVDISLAEACINRGEVVPAGIVNTVLGK